MKLDKIFFIALTFNILYTPVVYSDDVITVLDFEEFDAGAEGLIFSSGFTSKGYIFEATNGLLAKSQLDNYYGIWGSNAGIRYTGQSAFRQNLGGGSSIGTRMARSDRRPFTLISVDLWEHWSGFTQSPQTITYYGTDQDNNLVTQSFLLDRTWGGQTFYFSSEFSNLKYVQWTNQGTTLSSYHQLDNIVISAEEGTSSDINNDGLVDLRDLLLLQKELLGNK